MGSGSPFFSVIANLTIEVYTHILLRRNGISPHSQHSNIATTYQIDTNMEHPLPPRETTYLCSMKGGPLPLNLARHDPGHIPFASLLIFMHFVYVITTGEKLKQQQNILNPLSRLLYPILMHV